MRTRTMTSAVVIAFLAAFAPGVTAQNVRMTATIQPAEYEGALDEVRALCPQCGEGAVATVELTLVAPEPWDGYSPARSFVLGAGGNEGRVLLGGEAWPLLGTLVVLARRDEGLGSIVLERPAQSRPLRGVVRASLKPWLSVDFSGIPLDGAGRLAPVSTAAIQYDSGDEPMSILLCRGAGGEECVPGFALSVQSVTIHPGPPGPAR